MRSSITICVSMALAAVAPCLSGAEKSKPALPKQGIKTAGIQILFDTVRPEAEFATPSNPSWIGLADTVFIPNPERLDRIDPKSKESKLLEPISGIAKPCGGIVSAFGSLWAAACGDGALLKLDPKTAKVTSKLAIGAGTAAGLIAASTDSLWMLTDDKTTLSRIDPQQTVVVGEFRLPAGCASLTFAETALWVACTPQNKVLRINADSGLVEKSIEVAAHPKSLAAGEGSVWVLCAKDGKVDRIDPKTNKVSKSIELLVPGAEGAIAFGEGSLWVSLAGFPLTRINAQTEQVVQQFYGEGGGAIQAGQGFLWLSNRSKGTLWKIDPKRVAATLAE